MGHTLEEWADRVSVLVRDEAGKHLAASQLEQAVRTAIAAYSVDRPRLITVEQAGTGSPYLTLPAGWVTDVSRVVDIEFPARQNPPELLDRKSWVMTRSTADVSVEQILLDRTPLSTQWVRITFSASWPYPTTVAADDKIDDLAYEAVAALAASLALTQLAAEASRSQSAALPSDFSDGTQRAPNLLRAAEGYSDIYKRFLGITVGEDAAGSAAPAWGYYDHDPTRRYIFHGGRR